jgi:hypothetical protein
LHHDERYQHDPEDRRDHEQEAANDVCGHLFCVVTLGFMSSIKVYGIAAG